MGVVGVTGYTNHSRFPRSVVFSTFAEFKQEPTPPRGCRGMDPNEEMQFGSFMATPPILSTTSRAETDTKKTTWKRTKSGHGHGNHGNHGIQENPRKSKNPWPKNEDPMSQISENCPQFSLTRCGSFLAMGQPLGRPHLVPVAPSPEGISPFLLHHPHGDQLTFPNQDIMSWSQGKSWFFISLNMGVSENG